jgi:aryl-alcohol dehydrogenase-like predicted oxidoreductase
VTARLWLGTAQLGIEYGISNTTGRIGEAEAAALLQRASALSIDTLDTAPAYGASERVLGELGVAQRFRIVTKTPQLRRDTITPADAGEIERSLDASLLALRSERVYGLLVHWPGDLIAPGADHVYASLDRAKRDGRVERIGVSVYAPQEVAAILDRYDLDLVQIPLNVFDQRFLRAGTLDLCAARGLSVHCRSAFLQGLLLMSVDRLPARVAAARSPLAAFHDAVRAAGRSRLDACLGFVASVPKLDAVVCGVTAIGELEEVAAALGSGVAAGRMDVSAFAVDDPAIIDPRQWA